MAEETLNSQDVQNGTPQDGSVVDSGAPEVTENEVVTGNPEAGSGEQDQETSVPEGNPDQAGSTGPDGDDQGAGDGQQGPSTSEPENSGETSTEEPAAPGQEGTEGSTTTPDGDGTGGEAAGGEVPSPGPDGNGEVEGPVTGEGESGSVSQPDVSLVTPAKPVLTSDVLEVISGNTLTLTYTTDSDTRLEAYVSAGTGSVSVSGNEVIFTPETVSGDSESTINVVAIHTSGGRSESLDTVVTTKPQPQEEGPKDPVVSVPAKPVLASTVTNVNSGETLTLRFNIDEGATLTAEVLTSNGSARVEDKTVVYSAPVVDTDGNAVISIKAVNSAGESEALNVNVNIKAPEVVTNPDESGSGSDGSSETQPDTPQIVTPAKPIYVSGSRNVTAGETTQLKFSTAENTTLSARITAGVGSVEVLGNNVNFTAPEQVDVRTSATIAVKAVHTSGGESAETSISVVVNVKPVVAPDVSDGETVDPEPGTGGGTDVPEVPSQPDPNVVPKVVLTSSENRVFVGNTLTITYEQVAETQVIVTVPEGQGLATASDGIISYVPSSSVISTEEVILTIKAMKDGVYSEAIPFKVVVEPREKVTLTVTPESYTGKVGDTISLSIVTEAFEYTIETNKDSIATVDQANKTVTGIGVGSATITVRASLAGKDDAVINIPVTFEALAQATAPIAQLTTNTVVSGNELTFTYIIADGDRLHVTVPEGKGSVSVIGNRVVYTPHITRTQDLVILQAVAISPDNVSSAPVETVISVSPVKLPPVTLEVTPVSAEFKAGTTINVEVTTDAQTVELRSSDEKIARVDSDNYTITGVAGGEAIVTVIAQHPDKSTAQFNIPVIVRPLTAAKVPVLTSKVLDVQSEGRLELEFEPLSEGGHLVFMVPEGKGSIEFADNFAVYTAFETDKTEKVTIRVYEVSADNLKSNPIDIVIRVRRVVEEVSGDIDIIIDPSATIKYSEPQIKVILNKTGITVREKLDLIKYSGPTSLKEAVDKLDKYEAAMNPEIEIKDSSVGATNNYSLYTLIKNIASTRDYEKFKLRFDIINLYFKEYQYSGFNEFLLQRFDEKWSWGEDNLITYQNLITVITSLCDITKRASNLKRLDLDKALDPTVVRPLNTNGGFAIQNIKAYYKE